jgi:signal transduction histidine kinase
MQNSNPSSITDWIVNTLRWLILLSIAISLATGSQLTFPIILLLLGGALWNALLTILAALNRRLVAHPQLNVAGDLLIAYLLIFLSRGAVGQLVWAGLLPLISASIYLPRRVALIIVSLNLVAQGVLAWFLSPMIIVLVTQAVLLPVYLGLVLLFGYLSQRINENLLAIQLAQTSARQEIEQAEQERRRLVYNLVSALNSTLNYQKVLDMALDMSANALTVLNAPADRLVSSVLLFVKNENNKTELNVGSARRFTSSDMRITLPGASGLIGHTIDEGEPQLSLNLSEDPELDRVITLRACHSAYCFPLRSGLDTYGVLLFAHPDGEFFTPDRCEILNIVGNQSVIAIQNARLYQDLEREKERMAEIQEEARNKMARDLHDGPTQSVAAIAMRANFARRLIDRDVKAASNELEKIEDMARRTTKEIRHMLFTLRPLILESQGLIAALQSMAEKMHETYNQHVVIKADAGVVNQLEPAKQTVAFYIVEEAVNNARKHAKADHIWVRLKPIQGNLALLEIEDNGVGFDVGAVESSYDNRGSLGMVNMRERTDLVNGLLQVESTPGKGTRIRVLIPLNEEASDRIRRGMQNSKQYAG